VPRGTFDLNKYLFSAYTNGVLLNIYMGENRSIARIPTKGKVNDPTEVFGAGYATAFDAVNGRLLTRKPGKFDDATIREINGRFAVVKLLCRKNCPSRMPAIEKLHSLTISHIKGRISESAFIRQIREIGQRYNVDMSYTNLIEQRINMAEMQKHGRNMMPPNPFLKGKQNDVFEIKNPFLQNRNSRVPRPSPKMKSMPFLSMAGKPKSLFGRNVQNPALRQRNQILSYEKFGHNPFAPKGNALKILKRRLM